MSTEDPSVYNGNRLPNLNDPLEEATSPSSSYQSKATIQVVDRIATSASKSVRTSAAGERATSTFDSVSAIAAESARASVFGGGR